MRVLHCTKALETGGAEKQLRLLAAALLEQGIDPAIVCFKRATSAAIADGVRLYLGRKCSLFWPPTWTVIDRAIRDFRPDVVQAWLPPSATVPALFYAWRHGIPAIFCFRNSMRLRGARGAIEWLATAVFADRIVANNNAQNSSTLYRWLYRRKRGLRIGNIVPAGTRPLQGKRREAGQRLRLLYVGRLAKQKNVDCLLRATALLKQHGIDFELAICGDGRQRRILPQLAQRLGVDGVVRFLGTCRDVEEQLRQADLLILPSWREGIPNVVLEAWQNGLPCLISDIPAHRDLIGTTGAAELFDPSSAQDLAERIVELSSDPKRLSLLARSATALLAAMTPQVVAGAYARLYKEMCAQGAP